VKLRFEPLFFEPIVQIGFRSFIATSNGALRSAIRQEAFDLWTVGIDSPQIALVTTQVPCQSSPSIQVTPVTKRLDSMVRRLALVGDRLDGSSSLDTASRAGVTHYDSRSERAFTSSLRRRTISIVLRISASLRAAPIVDAIKRNRAFSSR
jgi:hypothetical protein